MPGTHSQTTRLAVRVLPALLCAALAAPAGAARLEAVVRDGDGEPVRDSVVYALAQDASGEPAEPTARTEIDQVDKEFLPYVSAVRVGTRIHFPNRDQIRHHVYSFSDAKTFEIPLYAGTPAEPILFDRPGPVVLGCNIHDWMRAYVLVVETPHFGVTGADGRVDLELPAGSYSVRVWHPDLAGDPAATSRQASIEEDGGAALGFEIEPRRVWRPRRSPSTRGPGYR